MAYSMNDSLKRIHVPGFILSSGNRYDLTFSS